MDELQARKYAADFLDLAGAEEVASKLRIGKVEAEEVIIKAKAHLEPGSPPEDGPRPEEDR